MSSKRRDHLKALFSGAPGEGTPPSPPEALSAQTAAGDTHERDMPVDALPLAPSEPPARARAPAPAPARTSSGAVRAMGLQLSSVSRELDAARALQDSLSSGDRIVEIDPELIDPSIVRDRLSVEEDGDEAFLALVESLRDNGQQVPVLVRPHPDNGGRFQTAYGHRRVRASARLGRKVRAIVRSLSDSELILAQGKENTERRNLSFIERAFFARSLVRHGFDRAMVERALSLHKAEMTRFLQVADAVPEGVARAIGPAPKAGRPRWLALAQSLREPGAIHLARDIIAKAGFSLAPSDERFRRVHDGLAGTTTAERPVVVDIPDDTGRVVARLTDGARLKIEFEPGQPPGMADYLAERLPDLLKSFETRQSTDRNRPDEHG
jgi:ParB family transcriptional regulator, chromosome partitioning protein